MRNLLSIILYCGICILLCGCDKTQKLTCTKMDTPYGYTANQMITIIQHGNKVKKLELELQLLLELDHIKDQEIMIKNLEDLYQRQRKEKGITWKLNQADGKVVMWMNIDPSIASENVSGVPYKIKYEDMKEHFQKNGYQCK